MKKKLLSTLLVLALVLALLPTGAAAYGEIINDQPKPWEIYEYDETYFDSWNDYWQYMYQNGYIYYNGEWIYVGSDYDTGYYDITYSYDYTEGYVSGPSSSDGGEWISFSVVPRNGYEVDTVSVWSYGSNKTISSTDSIWMPYSAVTVYVSIKQPDTVWDAGL